MSELAAVRDLECVVVWSPLRFDQTAIEVAGAGAVLRRVLIRWCSTAGSVRHAPGLGLIRPLTQLSASTFSPEQLLDLEDALRREALEEDFVDDCSAPLSLVGARLWVPGAITLVDGKTYPLEVAAGAASLALLAIGAS